MVEKMVLTMVRTLAVVFLLSGTAYAQDPSKGVFYCRLVSISDGDTIKVSCGQNIAPHKTVRLRIFGLDTPESRFSVVPRLGFAACKKEAKLGISAKAWAKSQYAPGDVVAWEWVSETGEDPRGRTIARVKLKDGKDWASEMIRIGLGAPYDPTKDKSFAKPNWCE